MATSWCALTVRGVAASDHEQKHCEQNLSQDTLALTPRSTILPPTPTIPTLINSSVDPPRQILTRSVTFRMTTNAVLNTGELLEKILTALPLASQVQLRRVNRLWDHIILTLPHISQSLPASTTTPTTATTQHAPPTDLAARKKDPLFKKAILIFDMRKRTIRPYDSIRKSTRQSEKWKQRQLQMKISLLNTHFFIRDPFRGSLLQRAEKCESIRLARNMTVFADERGKLNGEEVLKRNMYICFPPVKTVELRVEYHVFFPSSSGALVSIEGVKNEDEFFVRIVRLSCPGGVRFSDLVDAFLGEGWGKEEEEPVGNKLRPSYGEQYEILGGFGSERGKKGGGWALGSCVWMLGALFLDEGEGKGLMGKRRGKARL